MEGYTLYFDLEAKHTVSPQIQQATTAVRHALVPIASIGRTQARRERENVERIKQKLQKDKVLYAVTVTTTEEDPGAYKFEEGHHRAMACKDLGFTTVPADILVIDKVSFERYPTVSPPFL